MVMTQAFASHQHFDDGKQPRSAAWRARRVRGTL